MIIQQIYKTYKTDFPLLAKTDSKGILLPPNFNIWESLTNLIVELSVISRTPKYCYITRHTDDTIPENILSPLKEQYFNFVYVCKENFNNRLIFIIPIIWYVAFFKSSEEAELIENSIKGMNIKYLPKDKPTISDSIETIKPDNNYTINQYEASNFPKFLHQVTQIGIDLLKNPVSLPKLKELINLEGMQYTNEKKKISDIEDLRKHLLEHSAYYLNEIEFNDAECRTFWYNFNIVRLPYSWPHFLFNICDVINMPA